MVLMLIIYLITGLLVFVNQIFILPIVTIGDNLPDLDVSFISTAFGYYAWITDDIVFIQAIVSTTFAGLIIIITLGLIKLIKKLIPGA